MHASGSDQEQAGETSVGTASGAPGPRLAWLRVGDGALADALVCLVCVLLFTVALGRLDLFEPDETRHAEIASEMLAQGSFLTPTLQGRPYYEKPVLYHWLVAASMAVLGKSEAAARLPSALAGLWTLLMIAWFADRAHSRQAARLVALGLATTGTFTAIGRYVLTDMLFTAALTTAWVWLGLWFLDREGRRSILPVYAFTGLAVLVKGPVAVILVGLSALIAATWRFGVRGLLRLRPLAGLLVGAAVCVPWYAAAWLADPTYVETFLWTNNVRRYLAGNNVGHPHPWYYYGWTMPAALLPWVALLPAALRERLRREARTDADLFLAIWALVVVGFFSTANSKIVTYVLPAFPPLLCLAAFYVAEALDHRGPRLPGMTAGLCKTWVWTVAAVTLVATAYAFWHVPEWGVAVSGGCGTAVLVLVGYRVRHTSQPAPLLLAAALSTALGMLLVFWGPVSRLYNRGFSEAVPARILARELPAGAPVLAYKLGGHAIAFYGGRFVQRIDDIDELSRRLREAPDAALLVRLRYLPRLGLEPLPPGYEILWQSFRDDALLRKRPPAD